MNINLSRIRAIILVVVGGIILLGVASDSRVNAAVDRGVYEQLKVFTEVLSIIEKITWNP